MLHRKYITLLVLISSVAWLGCQRNVNMFGEHSTDYHRVLKNYTQEHNFFDLGGVRYMTTVTYESAELRKAYVDEYSQEYRLAPSQKDEMLKKEMEEVEKHETFFISHFAQDRSVAKLTPDAKVWRLSLEEAEPESITALSKTDPVIRYFHPESNQWTRHYLVKFPKRPEGQRLQFRMSGVVAQLVFDFPAR